MKNCTVADYNGVTEKAEEMEQECFLKMAQELIPDEKNSGEEPQNKKGTGQETLLFSGYTVPEKSQNGLSCAEIKETTLCISQAAVGDKVFPKK